MRKRAVTFISSTLSARSRYRVPLFFLMTNSESPLRWCMRLISLHWQIEKSDIKRYNNKKSHFPIPNTPMKRSNGHRSCLSNTLLLGVIAGSLLVGSMFIWSMGKGVLSGQIAMPIAPVPQCTDGLQVCRCYCRADFKKCTDAKISNSSMPLCSIAWNKTDCSALGYYQEPGLNAAACVAREGMACKGFIRPGDAPDVLIGQPTVGAYIGCAITAVN